MPLPWMDGHLLCPGAASRCWWTPGGLAWAAQGDGLWVEQGRGVVRAELEAVGLVADQEGLVAWDAEGRHVEQAGHSELSSSRWPRRGLHTCLERSGGGWRARGMLLPDGAVEARWIAPWLRGEGVLWSSRGWLYRMAAGQRPRAVDDLGAGEVPLAGPHGAFLVGREGLYLRGTAPGRGPRPLPSPLREPRWSEEGDTMLGVADEGVVEVDLLRSTQRLLGPGSPVDGSGRILRGGEVLLGEEVVAQGLRGGAWALDDTRLAGPGGMVWELRGIEPIQSLEVPVDGCLAWGPQGLLAVDRQGAVWLALPDGAELLARLPLEPGDEPESCWLRDGLVVRTLEGRAWRVDDLGGVRPLARARAPLPPPPPPGVSLGAHTLRWRRRSWPIRAAHATLVSRGLLAWTHGGLMALLPR